ncbi:MAG: pyrroline-5-carboxylate reductase [Chlamydiae bacterium]|nr:pyrroline-5-carboxylate reductase [Chlamydiota bacterium]
MKMDAYRLGFVGFGHMAQILCKRIIAARLIPRSQIQFIQRDPAKMRRNEQKYGITSTSLKHLVESSDTLFLCVRPGQMPKLALEMTPFGVASKKILSILSGISISFFQKCWGPQVEVAWVMPNVASSIGEGMTTLSFSPDASTEFKSFTERLVAPFGQFLEVPEAQMNTATAVAGSGPGFIFKLIQAMAEAGEKGGLPREKALAMAAQTFAGAARLVASGENLSDLIAGIATPGGTTEAGFQVMEQSAISEHFQKAIHATIEKAKALAH